METYILSMFSRPYDNPLTADLVRQKLLDQYSELQGNLDLTTVVKKLHKLGVCEAKNKHEVKIKRKTPFKT